MKRTKLGNLSLESFDQAPTGNVNASMQAPEQEQPALPTSGYFETPFSGQENYAAEMFGSGVEHKVAELWKTLLSHYKSAGDGDLIETLNPGAPLANINKIESQFHVKLPEAYVALLSLADGQNVSESHDASHEIFGHRIFNSIEMVLEQTAEFQRWNSAAWRLYTDYDTSAGVKETDWNNKWIVFGGHHEGEHKPSMLVMDFDPDTGGKVGQIVAIDLREGRRVVVGPDFLTWLQRFVSHQSQKANHALESLVKPPYPLRKALEADAVVVDEDELDQLALQANSLTTMLDDNSGVAMEGKSVPSDIAKSKMHLRFKKLKDGFVDTFRSAAGMAAKYEKRLDELETELLQGHVHGQIKVNLSGVWQHFSDEKGPITHNLVGKVREDLEFSRYILTVFSQKAFEELKLLSHALHTGQGNSDEQAKRTAMDVEKLEGPAHYFDQKWNCAAGEQPYLSVTGLYAVQGRHPRPVAIEGASLDKLAELATPYTIREFGSFTHGIKKLFVHNSKKEVHMATEDLAKLITMGREYITWARHYLEIYNAVWPIFRKIDDSLDLIWDDFGLTDYEINLEGEAEDGSDDVQIKWQTSDTGNVRRRLVVFDQLMAVVRNFVDVVLEPGVHEMARALRAAKFHGYLVAAGIKAAEGHGNKVAQEHRAAMESMSLEFFFGKKQQKPAEYSEPDWKSIPKPDWDPKNPPSLQDTVRALRAAMQAHDPEGLKSFNRPATVQEMSALAQLVKQHTGKDLPKELIELYKISNGGISSYKHLKLFDYEEFIPVHEVIADYKQNLAFRDDDWADSNSKVAPGVKGEKWWEPWWIPFTASGSGDSYCVDVDPGAGGHPGQVIGWYHDADDRVVRYPSIAAFAALSLHRQLFLLQHKKDWQEKNGTQDQQ